MGLFESGTCMFRTGIDFIILDHSCDVCVLLTPIMCFPPKHHTQTHPPKKQGHGLCHLSWFPKFWIQHRTAGNSGWKDSVDPQLIVKVDGRYSCCWWSVWSYSWWFRNPACTSWYGEYLPLFTEFYTSQVVGLGISEPSTVLRMKVKGLNCIFLRHLSPR